MLKAEAFFPFWLYLYTNDTTGHNMTRLVGQGGPRNQEQKP